MKKPVRLPDDPRFTPITLRREYLADGWTDQSIARSLRAGLIFRVRQGAYVDAQAWAACDVAGRHEVRARAVLKQARAPGVLSHATGAVVWDVSTYDQSFDDVDFTRTDGKAGRAEAGVRQHKGALLDEDVTERHGIAVVSATRLSLEMPTVYDLEHSYCYVGELLHRQETTREAMAERYLAMRGWPGSLSAEVLLRRVHGECESVGEYRTDYLIWRQHLPEPVRQYAVRDPDSGEIVARVDFAWPELGVFLEFDGKVKYHRYLRDGETIEDAVLREKAREEHICELTGWRCIRLVWADLYRPEHTALRIRRVLSRSTAA